MQRTGWAWTHRELDCQLHAGTVQRNKLCRGSLSPLGPSLSALPSRLSPPSSAVQDKVRSLPPVCSGAGRREAKLQRDTERSRDQLLTPRRERKELNGQAVGLLVVRTTLSEGLNR